MSLVVKGLDIENLEDEALYEQLSKHGVMAPAITATTRKTYQRKLASLMGADVYQSQQNGDAAKDESEEDEEEVEVVPKEVHKVTKTIVTTTSYTSPEPRDVRKRPYKPREPVTETFESSIEFDPMRHTPSPRRSLRSVHGTYDPATDASVTSRSFAARRTVDAVDAKTPESEGSSVCRLLVKLCIFVLIFVGLYYSYQNYYSESPFLGLEELARKALEAVDKENKIQEESPEPLKTV